MFVLFDRLFQGYLSANELPRDYWELNELETAMVGRRSSRAYKIADLLPVRVVAIDEARGRVDLTLAGGPDGEDGGGGIDDGGDTGGPPRSHDRQHGSRKPKTTRTRAARAGRPPQARGRR